MQSVGIQQDFLSMLADVPGEEDAAGRNVGRNMRMLFKNTVDQSLRSQLTEGSAPTTAAVIYAEAMKLEPRPEKVRREIDAAATHIPFARRVEHSVVADQEACAKVRHSRRKDESQARL